MDFLSIIDLTNLNASIWFATMATMGMAMLPLVGGLINNLDNWFLTLIESYTNKATNPTTTTVTNGIDWYTMINELEADSIEFQVAWDSVTNDVSAHLEYIGQEGDVLAMARHAATEAEALFEQVAEQFGTRVPGVKRVTQVLDRASYMRGLADISLEISKGWLGEARERLLMRDPNFVGFLTGGQEVMVFV